MSTPQLRLPKTLIGLGMAAIVGTFSCGPALAQNRDSIEEMVPPVDRSESIAARSEQTRARLALVRAQQQLSAINASTEQTMRRSDAFRELQVEVNRTRARFEAIRQPILDALLEDEEYARLKDQTDTARMIIRRLSDEERAGYLELLPHARRALEAGRKMSRAEVIALALDPQVEDARAAMIAAYGRLRDLLSNFRREAGGSRSVRLAVQDLEAARARVEAANRALATALEREAAAELDRERRIRSIQSGMPVQPPADRPRERRPTTRPASN